MDEQQPNKPFQFSLSAILLALVSVGLAFGWLRAEIGWSRAELRASRYEESAVSFPVFGEVTLGNGQAVDPGLIFFHSQNDRTFVALIKSGEYDLGLIPLGPYQVTIEGSVNGKPIRKSYQSVTTSGLVIDVSQGDNVVNFEL